MKKIITSVIFLCFNSLLLFSEPITFRELTNRASTDLGVNIYLDKDIPEYSVDFNVFDNQNQGEIYEFYKIVLGDNDMYLDYNSRGKFYYVKQKNSIPDVVDLVAEPLPSPRDRMHYYSYKIKNITNKDVIKVMSIFHDVKYSYLEQSDMIAYSCVKRKHSSILKMLKKSDNSVVSSQIKITLFTTNKTKLMSYGSNISAFNFNFSSKLDGVLSALKNGNSQSFTINDNAIFDFSLYALEGRGLADIMQEPTLHITNGVKASVHYVKNISYKTSSITRKDTTETTTDQIEYRDIGFNLDVLPKIKSNWVYLKLNLTSEELLTSDNNQFPVTQKISYKSSVKVYKGKPILLTGLRKTSERYEREGIPLLKNIPLLGELFKNRKVQKDEQNINIMIEII